jgi:serpin B
MMVATSLSSALSAEDVGKKPVPVPAAKSAAASNQFGWDLYAKLGSKAEGENLFFSPTSISMALGMTYAGARGDTAEQMAKVLHWEGEQAGIHADMAGWIAHLNAIDQGQEYELRVANRLWAQRGYAFLPEFLKITRERYRAELGQVNFESQTEQARQTINRWVEQQTAQKIENLLPRGAIEARTKLVLTNAIYFKGDWETPFKKSATRDEDFQVSSSNKRPVPMMRMREDFRFARGDGLKVLEMPYKGGSLSAVIVLPDEVDGLAKVEEGLSADRWKEWMGKLGRKEVDVHLPRFKLTCDFSLSEALVELGMPLAFDEGSADFSGMNGKHDLFISEALHKAYVDVNERGTEAAAATAVLIAPASAAREPEKPEEFHADHPFLFAIWDGRAGAALFVGRVMDPGR